MTTDTHEALIDGLVADGWTRSKGWKEAVRALVLQEPFCGQDGVDGLALSESFSEAPIHPDAYRLLVEGPGHGWGEHQVLVIELAEVVVTHRISQAKLAQYANLWWNCDGSGYCHLRLYVMDEFGTLTCLADLDPDVFKKAGL